MVITFLENALNLGIFAHALLPSQNSRQNFFKIYFLQQQKGVEKTNDMLYQNLITKYQDDCEH